VSMSRIGGILIEASLWIKKETRILY